MDRVRFATYLHPETVATSKPVEQIPFVGYSCPHFSRVRSALAEALAAEPALPLCRVGLDAFRSVHTDAYLRQLTRLAAGFAPEQNPKLNAECAGLWYCMPGYEYGLGGMLEAIEHMKRGTLDRAYCFSLGGHHAHADWGHGYCLLNPLAAAVRHAQSAGFQRVVVVDWDLHHGDGTQAIFAHDSSVFCISIHSALDLYMAKACGWHAGTTTAGAATGHCNIPILNERFDQTFPEQLGLPGVFYRAVEGFSAFQATLRSLPWQPDLLCIFSGYDAHQDDRGRRITNWTNDHFARLTREVLDCARRANAPTLSVHGGGYNLPVTVAAAVRHVEVLATERRTGT
jgi:acetoin utilization deacetylase AcuC-like enzyme